MDKQEFKKFWDNCINPTYEKLLKKDDSLYIRDGSFDSLCRCYNDIKNHTKRMFMKKSEETIRLDRHKIAACMAKAIVIDRPICKKVDENYNGAELDFVIANEALAFSVAISILEAYIRLRLESGNSLFESETIYIKICDNGFCFPDTIMHVDYKTSVCWAWHQSVIEGHFDVLGAANLFFMIENYSLQVYSK